MFERRILRRIYGPIQDKVRWLPRWNSDICNSYKYLNIVENIKIRRLGWACHIIRVENGRFPKGFLRGNFIKETVGKTKNKMGGRCLDGHITDLVNTRKEKMIENSDVHHPPCVSTKVRSLVY